MRPELETYQQIDKFLNGELDGDALASFQQRLQSDVEFAEEVSLQKLTNEVVIGASFDSLRSQMSKDIDKIDSSNTGQMWGLASIGLAVISAGIISLYSSTHTDITTHHQAETPAAETKRTIIREHTAPTQLRTEQFNPVNTKEVIASAPAHTTPESATKQENPSGTTLPDNTTVHAADIQPADIKKTPATNTEKTTVDPCLQASITANIIAAPSCADASNGSIKIPFTEIKGGTKPYAISFNQAKPSATKESYTYLKADTYTITISDANGCTKTYTTNVDEKNCRTKSFIFAPDKGETWSIEGINNDSYVLTILNIAGRQVFKTNTMQGAFEWQGVSQQGEYLDAGLYIYIMEYTNGSKENGQVTIVR